MELFLHSWKFVRYEITKNTAWYCVYVRTTSGQETLVEFTKGTQSNGVGKLIDEILATIADKRIPDEGE